MGDLLEFGPSAKIDPDAEMSGVVRFLGELLTIAIQRRYHPGWVFHTFEARFGRPPTADEQVQARAVPVPPSQATLAFVMAKHRAYATRGPEQPVVPAAPAKATPKRKTAAKTNPKAKPKTDARLAPGLYVRRGCEDFGDALDYPAGTA